METVLERLFSEGHLDDVRNLKHQQANEENNNVEGAPGEAATGEHVTTEFDLKHTKGLPPVQPPGGRRNVYNCHREEKEQREKEKNSNLSSKIKALQLKLKKKTDEVKELQQEKKQCLSELDKTIAELKETQNQNSSDYEFLANASRAIKEAERSRDEAKENAEFKELINTQLRQENTQLREENTQLREENIQLESKTTHLEEENRRLEEEIKTLNKELNNVKKELETKKQEILNAVNKPSVNNNSTNIKTGPTTRLPKPIPNKITESKPTPNKVTVAIKKLSNDVEFLKKMTIPKGEINKVIKTWTTDKNTKISELAATYADQMTTACKEMGISNITGIENVFADVWALEVDQRKFFYDALQDNYTHLAVSTPNQNDQHEGITWNNIDGETKLKVIALTDLIDQQKPTPHGLFKKPEQIESQNWPYAKYAESAKAILVFANSPQDATKTRTAQLAAEIEYDSFVANEAVSGEENNLSRDMDAIKDKIQKTEKYIKLLDRKRDPDKLLDFWASLDREIEKFQADNRALVLGTANLQNLTVRKFLVALKENLEASQIDKEKRLNEVRLERYEEFKVLHSKFLLEVLDQIKDIRKSIETNHIDNMEKDAYSLVCWHKLQSDTTNN